MLGEGGEEDGDRTERQTGRHLSEGVVQLDQLEGGQQLPGADLPHVHVEELQVRLLVQLVHGLKLGLCEGPAQRLGAPLQTRKTRDVSSLPGPDVIFVDFGATMLL